MTMRDTTPFAPLAPAMTGQSYSRSVFLAIVGDGLDEFLRCREYPDQFDNRPIDSVRIDDCGVWVHPNFGGLAWTYLCDLGDPRGKNPLDEPALRFDFTAGQLAAFMLDGVGYFVRQMYGTWKNGPDPLQLQSLGVQGTKAREALQSAYQLYRDAERNVGPLDDRYLNAEDLDERYEQEEAAYGHALGVINERSAAERTNAAKAQGEWRKSMVRALVVEGFEPVPKQVSAQRAQEEAILNQLRAMGYDPEALPRPPAGKAFPAKKAIQAALNYSNEVMRKAWSRLRADKRIRNA